MLKRYVSSFVLAAFAGGTLMPVVAEATPTPPPAPAASHPPLPNVNMGYVAPHASPSPPPAIGITSQPYVGITLENAIGMALLKNPNLAVDASDTRIASYQIVSAKGAFDVHFNVEPSVTHSTTAPSNPFFAGPGFTPLVQNQQQIQAGVAGQTVNGTEYDVAVGSARIDNNSIFNGFNPYYTPTLSFNLTQPLLKNAGENRFKNELNLAVIGSDASQASTLTSVSQTIAQVENAYWDLSAAWREVAIQEEALHEAMLQQSSTRRLAKQGASANIDVVESTSQVATFQDNVYSALQTVAQVQNELKNLVVSNPADQIWQANLVPTGAALPLPPAPTLEGLVATAYKQRPEVREVADAQQQAAENERFAKNQLKPQVDIKLGYANNSWAGSPANQALFTQFNNGVPIVTPPYLVGGVGQAWSNFFSNKFPTYNAGVLFTAPLGNHTAKGDLAQAQEQIRIAQIQEYGIQQRILVEARNALQTYESALSRLNAARESREAREQVYASEVRKFRNGVSTTFLVLQRQEELADARSRELLAQTDLNKAVVEIERVSGNSLSANNVNLSTLGQGAAK